VSQSHATPAEVSLERHYEASTFLTCEAETLDQQRWGDWLDLLTDDVRYVMPIRVTAPRGAHDEVLGGMAHFDEDRYTLGKRVERLLTEYAWAEDPPSRTRRFVTNIRVQDGESPGELVVRSYLLLFRSRGDVHAADLVSAERTDTLRREADGLKLARREILVDESVLRTQNLAVFL
jgi:3-phenylpropionate/cinnamic acid dioxygenase small subunit